MDKILKALIVGTGMHAKFVAEMVEACGEFHVAGFVASEPGETCFNGLPVLGTDDDLPALRGDIKYAFVGVGDPLHNRIRGRIFANLKRLAFKMPAAIHPTAALAPNAVIKAGTVVGPQAIISTGAVVGENCIINCGAIVCHDCVIGDHCHIAPGGVLAGAVLVGDYSTIGMNASVFMGVEIGKHVLIHNNKSVFVDTPDGADE